MVNARDDKIILFIFTGKRRFPVIIEILKFGRLSFPNDRKYHI